MDRARIAVVTFPGSNDDGDARLALEALGAAALPVWHLETRLPEAIGGVVLPGGFSYGDYLRCGAIARVAPGMEAVGRFADDGGPVLGICNGFQIPSTGPPSSANRRTASITGATRAIAPQRR